MLRIVCLGRPAGSLGCILSDQFLAEVRGLKHKNVAAELLEKLLKDERGKCRMTNSECRTDCTS
jgi:hypothetical protein